VKSYFTVVSRSTESSEKITGALAMRSSIELPGGGTGARSRSLYWESTLAEEYVMPSRPTPRSPKTRCQLRPAAVRQPP